MIIPMRPVQQPHAKHSLDRKPKDYSKPFCQHSSLLVDPDKRTVECARCKEILDPINAFLVVCSKLWWEKQAEERQIELDEKRVAKVQKAAVEHLVRAGITPEEYVVRYFEEKARQDAAAKATAPAVSPEASLLMPDGGAA